MSKTLFVIGAGASFEAGLPLGSELKKKIATALDIRFKHGYEQVSGDEGFVEYLRFESRERTGGAVDLNPFLRECRKIAASMSQAPSIDNFLDAHAENEKLVFCGKLAIAKCILEAERASRLWKDHRNAVATLEFPRLEETWFARLFHKVVDGCRFEHLPERLGSVAFVIFNYDRCVEQYLSHAIANYFHVSHDAAIAVLENLEIYHPYGKVGELLSGDPSKRISFGADPHPTDALAVARGLRTFTEGTDPETSRITEIRNAIASARMITFLGFAYHRQNLELLYPKHDEFTDSRQIDVLGTGVGLSDRDIEMLRHELKSGLKVPRDRIHVQKGVGCYEFFSENSRNLSLV